jgi:hypothetical protein
MGAKFLIKLLIFKKNKFMKNLIKFIIAVITVMFLVSVSTAVFSQTTNVDFNAFVLDNGGDYSYQGNTIAVVAYNKANGTSYHTMWEMYVDLQSVVKIDSPLQKTMVSVKDTTIVDIFDIPAHRVDNVKTINSINSISTKLTFKPIVIKKAKISFGDTLILGKSKFALNIVLNKNIILSDEEVLFQIKQGKWLRIKPYTYIRTMSKPDFSIFLKTSKTAKRAGIKKSIWEGKCDRKKSDGLTLLSLVIVVLLYLGSKDYERRKQKRLLDCQVQEWQCYYESDGIISKQ